MNHAEIFVRFQAEGFHRWEDAPEGRSYLSSTHRHIFHVEVRITTTHDDREIEFHDLKDFCMMEFSEGDFGKMSCEMLARDLGEIVAFNYNRPVSVSVSEDGECGAIVFIPKPAK